MTRGFVLMMCVFATAFAFAVGKPAAADPKPEAKDLVVRSIKVVDEDGRAVVSMTANKEAGGVWVSDPACSGRNASLTWTRATGPYLSVTDQGTSGSTFAVASADREAYFQVIGKDGKVRTFPVKSLIRGD